MNSRKYTTEPEISGVRDYGSMCLLRIRAPAFDFPFFGYTQEVEAGCKTLEDVYFTWSVQNTSREGTRAMVGI